MVARSSTQFVYFTGFNRPRAWRRLLSAALLAITVAAPGAADASRTRTGGSAGAYDGTWNVVFTTRAGNCSATNNAPFAVSGTRVSSAGGGKVTGGIGRGGAVSVRLSVGLSVANGIGRLAGNSGTGHWSGVILGDKCSGTWQASRG